MLLMSISMFFSLLCELNHTCEVLFICVGMHRCECGCVCECAYMCACVGAVYVHACECVFVFVRVCVCVSVCLCGMRDDLLPRVTMGMHVSPC